MDILSFWLSFVALLRFSSVIGLPLFGFQFVQKLMYSRQPNQVTQLTCRLLVIWTLGNALVTSCASYYMDENKPIFVLAFLSFVFGLGHFLFEQYYFKTNFLRNNLIQLSLAGPSIIFMFLRILNW